MQHKRFSAVPRMRLLPEADMLGNVREVCRQHHMAEQTGSRWHRQCGAWRALKAQRLRTLEREKAALKRLVGERMLDGRRRKAVVGKKWSAGRPSGVRQHLGSRRPP